MASYDKPKLLALMEQRRTAHLSLLDLSERLRDANEERGTAKSKIITDSSRLRLPDGFLNRMLTLPTNEALALSADEVQTYTDRPGDDAPVYKTGINFATYRQFIHARDKVVRLKEAHENTQNNFNERFGIVARLRDAVREWGFADPELEM